MRLHVPSLKCGFVIICVLAATIVLPARAATKAAGSAPVIDEQPTSRVATEGGPVSLSVSAHATTAMTFEWRKGTQPLTNDTRVSGASTAVLGIDPVQASDTTNYSVVVSAGGISATSAPASLVVSQLVVLQMPTGPTGAVINAFGQRGDVYRIELNTNFTGYKTNGYTTNTAGIASYAARWANDGTFRQLRVRYDQLLPVFYPGYGPVNVQPFGANSTSGIPAYLNAYGKLNQVWRFEFTGDFTHWFDLVTVTNTTGSVKLTDPTYDPGDTPRPARFYRIAPPQ